MLYTSSHITTLFFIFTFMMQIVSATSIDAKRNEEQDNTTKTEQNNSTSAKKKKKKRKAKKEIHRTIKTMTLDELGPAKKNYLQNNQKEYACSCLERMITLENDIYKQKSFRLELGNLYFDLEKFEKAGKAFDEFVTMYPNSNDTQYAHFKAAQSYWHVTLSHDRDQDKTHECLKMANKYLENEHYKKYRKDVQDLARQCYKKLVDHETYICKFYLKKGKCKGAQQRLDYIREKYLKHVPDCEENVLCLECECASKDNDTELLEKKTAELTKKFPHHATKKITKRSYARRF